MIDIHSHILHSVDDGAQNVDDSIGMGRQEAEGGTTVVFATPHVYSVGDLQRTPAFAEGVAELQQEFERQNVGLALAQGAEIFPMMEVLDALGSGLPVTMAGKSKHILVDLPLGQWPMIMDRLTYELLAAGITPILAHPERTAPVHDSVEFLIPYLERGVLCQVNAGSLFGKYGPIAKKRAYQILTKRWASFLATDMHRPNSPGGSLKKAKDALADLPAFYIEQITVKNPRHVLDGTRVPTVAYDLLDAPPEKKGLGGLFKRRG